MSQFNTQIHHKWQPLFDKWNNKLKTVLDEVYNLANNYETYPAKENVFKAFEIDPTIIKIAMIFQDPYHGPNQAMGLAVSVPQDVKIPPSLVNIFKELKIEYPERNYNFKHGDLTLWMERESIFLLNCALTVKRSAASSHISKWQDFTNDAIRYLVEQNSTTVFLLLGNYAKEKAKIIKDDTRCIKGVHPSPLSAHSGFFNSNIFKQIETKIGTQVNWQN